MKQDTCVFIQIFFVYPGISLHIIAIKLMNQQRQNEKNNTRMNSQDF